MLSLRAELAQVNPSGLDWLRFEMFSFECFLENRKEHFLFGLTTLPGADSTQSLDLLSPVFLTNDEQTSKDAAQSSTSEACLSDGQLLDMTEIMQPSLYVLYIFTGSTSPTGLSTARLTASFFRAQHTGRRERRVCVRNCTQSFTLIERTKDQLLFSAGKWIKNINHV